MSLITSFTLLSKICCYIFFLNTKVIGLFFIGFQSNVLQHNQSPLLLHIEPTLKYIVLVFSTQPLSREKQMSWHFMWNAIRLA